MATLSIVKRWKTWTNIIRITYYTYVWVSTSNTTNKTKIFWYWFSIFFNCCLVRSCLIKVVFASFYKRSLTLVNPNRSFHRLRLFIESVIWHNNEWEERDFLIVGNPFKFLEAIVWFFEVDHLAVCVTTR